MTAIVESTVREPPSAVAPRLDEESFRALSEAGFDALFVHEAGTILMANEAMCELYRAPPGGLVGRSMFDFVAPQSRVEVGARVAAALTETFEGWGLRADGASFPVEVRARSVTFDGKAVRLVAVRDLTQRKRFETSLVLADRLAALGTVAAGVAHEINNPLAYILLNLELARNALGRGPTVSEEARQAALGAIGVAAEGATHIERVVGEVRTLARDSLHEGGSSDLVKVVTFACSLVKHHLQDRATLEVDAEPVPPVMGTDTRLGQVLLNLLMNAAQAIPRGSPELHRVTVRVRPEGARHVVLEVADTGEGVAPELLAHIFEPFVTTKVQGDGLGLGLSIAHGIVTSFGGTIVAESVLREGSTFRVRLPIAP
jgi:two-component system NtrC family sensor kinase